jgi:putative ABC transport system permease protein
VREILSPASAYVTPETYTRTIGPAGYTNDLRAVLNAHDAETRAAVMKEIEGALDRENISPKIVNSKARLEVALNGHVYLFIFPLMLISVLMVVVGGLGLMSAMGTSVAERTREIGVMRTIGGRSGTVLRNIMIEGIFIGLMSWAIAAVISVPLSWAIGRMLGMQAFRAPLPLVMSPAAIVIWLAIAVLGSAAASAYPAWKATQLTIRETRTYI